jgi:mannose-6-phosphate isomerase
LDDQFKDDIGVFCPYILNYITMQPGDAVYLGANEPHAYLSGDCVECMACSDNVVRAGLTPKFIDKVTLVKMLTYDVGYPSIISGEKVDENTRIYSPPIPEFEVERISMSAHSQYAAIVRTGPCLLLVLTGQAKSGDGLNLKRGGVYFVSANEQVTFVTEESDFVAYRASPNERIEEEEAHIQQ